MVIGFALFAELEERAILLELADQVTSHFTVGGLLCTDHLFEDLETQCLEPSLLR